MANVKGNTNGLDKLLRSLKDDYTVRVGILGAKAKAEHDNKSGLTNAEIGTLHELSENHRRSFLEEPLKEKLNFSEDEMKPFKKLIWQQFFVKNAPDKFFRKLGSKALDIIWLAFDTNGFGQWKPLTAAYAKRKAKDGYNANQILSATTTLRHSISFKVLKNNKK